MKTNLQLGLAVALMSLNFPLAGQEPLSDDEAQAVEQITLGRVRHTISFLASDELGGRGTPSPGFTVATAYVASRFRGAGLQGGGDDGGFYQETSLVSLQTPESGIRFGRPDGTDLPHRGLLGGGPQAVAFRGPLQEIELDGALAGPFIGPVVAGEPQVGAGRRAAASLARTVNQLKAAGATAVIFRTADASPLVAMAETNRAAPRSARRGRFEIPVLLIPETDSSLEGNVELVLPAEREIAEPVRNVIGILPGSDPELSAEAIVFTAHLDHLGIRGDGEDPIYNGADDDASGCTAVMAIADAYAALKQRPKRTVIFMTFWGEEQGLLGSRYFVENPTWPLEKIVANVNIEMVGRPEPGAQLKSWVTGWEQSNLGPLMTPGAARVGIEIFEHPSHSSRLYRASDNWPLAQAGVIAHSFSAGSLHGDYHQPSDHWEKLDLRHMTQVIRGLFVGSLPIASGEVTPTKSDQSR